MYYTIFYLTITNLIFLLIKVGLVKYVNIHSPRDGRSESKTRNLFIIFMYNSKLKNKG